MEFLFAIASWLHNCGFCGRHIVLVVKVPRGKIKYIDSDGGRMAKSNWHLTCHAQGDEVVLICVGNIVRHDIGRCRGFQSKMTGRFLRVMINERLNFVVHIEFVSRKVNVS